MKIYKQTVLSVTIVQLFLLSLMRLADATTSKDIANIGLASTVVLTMDNDSYGSGFFVLPDHIATSYHVVKGASNGYVRPVGQKGNYPIVGIAAIDKENDLVVLKISGVHGTPLTIGESGTIEIQDEVYAIGNPLGNEGTVTQGKLANHLGSRLLIDAKVSRGSCGGPLLSLLNGKIVVVGVVAAIEVDEIPGKGLLPGLNISIPSNYLATLVGTAKSWNNRLKPLTTEGVVGSHLTWLSSRGYTFSLWNQRNEFVRNMEVLVIFKDNRGNIICADRFNLRIFGMYPRQVRREIRLTYNDDFSTNSPVGGGVMHLAKSYEIRVLDFDIDPQHSRADGHYVTLDKVTGSGFKWVKSDKFPEFVYRLHNKTERDLADVLSYVVFYAADGTPIVESLEKQHLTLPAMGTIHVESEIRWPIKHLIDRWEFRILQETRPKN